VQETGTLLLFAQSSSGRISALGYFSSSAASVRQPVAKTLASLRHRCSGSVQSTAAQVNNERGSQAAELAEVGAVRPG
jgi:hypothetical protein